MSLPIQYGKLTLLTHIDTLGCAALQLPPPHVLAHGSKAIMTFLSFMLKGSTGATLDLSLQQLTTLPAACANTALVALKLTGNNLRCIPVEFGRCSLSPLTHVFNVACHKYMSHVTTCVACHNLCLMSQTCVTCHTCYLRCSQLTQLLCDDSSDWLWPPPPVMVGGAAGFIRATGALSYAASAGHLVLPGIGMRVLPPPLCDRAGFRQLVTVDVGANSIVALPLGLFMWLLQLQTLVLDRNKITAFPFCLFLRTHVVIHDAPPIPPSAGSSANLTAFPFARPLRISCQHNPLKDPFSRIARADAAVYLHVRLQV
jgi:hypothetical protein